MKWSIPSDVTGPRYFSVAKLSALPAQLGAEIDAATCQRRLGEGFPCYLAYYLPDGRLESVKWTEAGLTRHLHYEYGDEGVVLHPVVVGPAADGRR